jgi:hypothetical protein
VVVVVADIGAVAVAADIAVVVVVAAVADTEVEEETDINSARPFRSDWLRASFYCKDFFEGA